MMPHHFLVSTLTPRIVASIGLVFSVHTRPADVMVEVHCSETSNLIIVVNKIADLFILHDRKIVDRFLKGKGLPRILRRILIDTLQKLIISESLGIKRLNLFSKVLFNHLFNYHGFCGFFGPRVTRKRVDSFL